MLFARWLFLAAVACSCVLTSASRRASRADSQDVYRQYGEGRQHAEAEKPNYHHGPAAKPAKHIMRICLQQSSRTLLPGRVFEAKFRCCTPADEPDACVSNNTSYPGSYQRRRHRRGEDERAFWDVVTQEPAASCRYAQSDGACPTFASTVFNCAPVQANCTLGPAAQECGLPAGYGGLVFSTKLYPHVAEALVCDSLGAASGQARLLQGGINAIATREGYKECKGSVEFINSIAINAGSMPAQEPYPDLPWVKVEQQLIRLLIDTWDYQG